MVTLDTRPPSVFEMYLGWTDYAVLVLLLCLSAGIGIYQGCVRSKQLTTSEFLSANGRMKVLPTAMSLLASIMSAATLLGAPLEIYTYGTMYLYCMFSWFIGTYLTVKLFIPMFRQIGNISIYAYLEQRFSLSVRIAVTMTYIFINILYMAVVLYGPSVALSQVTGLHIWLAVGSCGIVCTLYTSIGGMKAVIWTDVAQTIVIYLGVVLSIIFGFIDAGGITKVFHTMIASDRLQFWTVTLDPSVRYTVWSMILGGSLYATTMYACLQTQAQRYMCVKDTKAAQQVAWINYGMCVMMLLLCGIVGCLLYAKYSQCDPLRAKLISKPDQLYPLFVIQTLGRFPGLTGLFIACILSASLSTISSGVNSTATVLLEDIYKRIWTTRPISDEQQAFVSKILSVFIGLLTVLLAFIVSRLGDNILVIVFQIAGSFAAPILGVFALGFFVPRVNSRSVLIAFLLCLIFQIWVLLGANLTAKQQIGRSGRLPTSIDGCIPSVNTTQPITANQSSNPLLRLYSISVFWYSFNGVLLTFILGLLVSFVMGSKSGESIDKSLLLSWRDLLCCGTAKTSAISKSDKESSVDGEMKEQEPML